MISQEGEGAVFVWRGIAEFYVDVLRRINSANAHQGAHFYQMNIATEIKKLNYLTLIFLPSRLRELVPLVFYMKRDY